MFGYVRVQKEELRLRQYADYRGIYCGLCRTMGKCTGQCSQLSLSYDAVFLYLIRAAAQGQKPVYAAGRCLLHPFRRRRFAAPDEELRYAARVSALLVTAKIRDDLADERGVKRMTRALALPATRRWEKRADLADLAGTLQDGLAALRKIEEEKTPSVDAPADAFGRMLGEVFSFGLSGDAAALTRSIGYRAGRWVYAVDAADDLEADAGAGRYNPFLLLYGQAPDDMQKKEIEKALDCDLAALAAALDLLPPGELVELAKNIVYLGMPDAARTALFGKETNA
ncbi:MAG: hypothetical protein IJU41_09455 [Clostridia bacterium]|nr:hypothetical protein [Clostridia bacterium]